MALTKINSSVIANNTIAVGNIADNSVDATKIASNSILTRHIDDDQITGDQLADNITVAGTLTTNALVVDDITLDGSSITDSGGLGIVCGEILTVDVTSNIILDAGGGQISFKDDGTEIGVLENSSSNFKIESKVQDKDIVFVGNDNGSAVTALTIDMSEGGNVGIGETSPAAPLHVEHSSSTAYNGATELTESVIISNKHGTDDSGVNNVASLGFHVADGATSQGFINYVRTGNNTGKFTISERTAANSYSESMSIVGGNVGIGETSPAETLDVSGNALLSGSDGTLRKLTFGATGGNHGSIGVDASGHTFIDAETAGGAILFKSGGTDYAKLLSSGKLAVTEISHISSGSLEIGNGDEKQIFDASAQTIDFQVADTERLSITASGITFNGDTAAANALDDYEEGTWTPANNGTQFSTQKGSYTKIGDRVFCQFEVIAGSGSSTGDWYGLPFTIRNSSDLGRGGGVVAYHNENNSESWHVSTENVNSTTFSIRMGSTQKQLTSGKRAWGFFSYLV